MLSVVTQNKRVKLDIGDYYVQDNAIKADTNRVNLETITIGKYINNETALEVFREMIEYEIEHKVFFAPTQEEFEAFYIDRWESITDAIHNVILDTTGENIDGDKLCKLCPELYRRFLYMNAMNGRLIYL